jgi:hypothetical protein
MRVLMYGNQWPNNYLDCAHTVWSCFGLEDQTLSMSYKRQPSYSLDIGHSIKCGSYQLMAHGTLMTRFSQESVLTGILLDSDGVTNLSVGG